MPSFVFNLYSRFPVFLQRALFWLAMAAEAFELAYNLADHMKAAADRHYMRMRLARTALERIQIT
jgi:hypothetical protein